MAGKSVQVGPEQYFDGAMAILANDGTSGLKIAPLCRALGVTSGSFYHHFGSWAGFVVALLEHWETEQTARIVALAAATADPGERVTVLKELAATVPHEAEAAIRVWAALDPDVGRAQARVDDERRAAVERVVSGIVDDPEVARRLAVLGLAVLVGFQQTCVPPVVDVLGGLLDDFEAIVRAHAR
ncbi:TetR/AcrR family transcriptional regulator [Pseudonocardia abyssalis]|uniref:TetR/AcrR family transcriptional regulator n=1 Tax=Pseudonocardia abyssalis TaxID=2792008 RepID=A0ABS6V0J2_9PSEU|nr:TetR/AcrR family transcriptional regulator [Pseudonocardia abyssalis]MBW0116457.1 TetR/AcrR family transcriptional regulator [Pseudonocardia abyssalis]MBW0138035.1 TetR/AcrR family transcriptional regulator [Pseudonocardia abyssalis]